VNVFFYLLIRLSLWLFGAVLVSVLPVVLNDDVAPSLNMLLAIESINKNGLFKELYFVIVPVSVLSLSTVVDYWCRKFQSLSGSLLALTILAFIFNILSLCAGLVGFVKIESGTPLADRAVRAYSVVLAYALIVSLLTEIGVAFTHSGKST
jgi:hypothetical protein